jgi:pimeloyl-ACP methyl ester carboxylesterase
MKVLLIHGLSRSPLSLMGLAWRLQHQGWQTEQFGYAAFLESFDHIVVRLRQQLQQLGAEPYSIVAHSLGGLLTRAALGHGAIPQPAHVVMLGTPNQRPRLAPLAWQLPPFQWCTGQCGFKLTQPDFFATLPLLRSPYTIVAGVGGPRGILSPFGDEANDGVVAVTETRLTAGDRRIELPVEHTFMMNDQAVQSTIVETLRSDRDR